MGNVAGVAEIVFGPFRLDPGQARLLRDGSAVELTPKAFDLLVLLARRPGELVTKDELLDAVWGRRFVTEGVIKTVVGQLREALGDDAREPRWIQTVPRRGYRFIGDVGEAARQDPQSSNVDDTPSPSAEAGPGIVGRGDTLALLSGAWRAAQQGRSGVVFVAGEPGIGKSTVIAAFVHGLQGGAVASGQCIEHHAGAEPYLPVLEALDALVRNEPARLAVLRATAPTWLAQLPWLLGDEERQALQRTLAGVAQERMLRELGVLLDRLAEAEPLLLVLEDLHWSDASTVQLLGHLARRRGPARWMVVGSYRPADVVAMDHPFDTLRRELRLHQLCQDVHLEGFSTGQVHEYLAGRLPGMPVGESRALAASLQAHTDGLPLFLACVVDELLQEGALRRQGDGSWQLPDASSLPLPDNLLHLTEKQMQRLPPEVHRLLSAAALAPTEFDHLALAAVLQAEPDVVQTELDALVRRRLWLRAGEPRRLPDGRVAACYSFAHALFRHAFGRQLGEAARVSLHRRLLDVLQAQYGHRAAEISVELALHAELAGEAPQAAQWLAVAAHAALQRIAPVEALQLASRGLAQLAAVPPGPARGAELPLLAARIQALTVTEGYGSAAVVQTVQAAFALVEPGEPVPQTMPLWHATWWTLSNAGLYEQMEAVERRLEHASRESAHGVVRYAALNLLAIGAIHRHELARARELLEQSLEVQRRAAAEPPPAGFVQDLTIETLVHLQYVHEVTASFADAARIRGEIERRLAAGTDPLSETMALWYMAYSHYYRRDLAAARALLARGRDVIAARSALPGHGPYHVLTSGVLALDGEPAEGARYALEGLRIQYGPEHGSLMGSGAARATVAQALLRNGQWDAAQRELDTASALAVRPQLRLCWPEQHRIQGALHWARGDGLVPAAAAWARAAAIGRDSGALLFELLAVQEWAAACDAAGQRAEACALLQATLERFGGDALAPDCPAVATAAVQLQAWRA